MAQALTSKTSSITWTARAMAGLFALAAFSQVKLHTLERGHTISLAQETKRYTISRPEYAKRGAILDTKGKPLANDESTYVLNINFRKIIHSPAFYMDLSKATGVPASEFAALADGGVKSREWKVPLGTAQYKAVQDVKYKWRCDAVSLRNTGRRSYPLSGDVSGIVGLVREGKPLMGLELSKNKVLKSQHGLIEGFVDRTGQFLPTRTQEKGAEKKDGESIQLTIDSDLQSLAAAAVRQAVEKHQAQDGVAIILDPSNGDLLALANAPSFDPYQPDGTDGDLSGNSGYNPAYMGVLEPGSTFKILTLAKALDEGKTTMSSHFYCGGTLQLNSAWRVRCDMHGGSRAHGQLDPTLAIAKSCNVWSGTWALQVGREKFIKYVEDLGLLRKTKLGLPQETQGLFNYNEYAKPLQLALVGFGQSITTSPTALAGAFGMLANGGVRLEPRLIKRIGNRDVPVDAGERIVKEETAQEVLRAMEAVVQSDAGTGKSLRIPGYRLGGKTGTAQKIGGGKSGYVSNFVGFVPADKPRAVILVMINQPKSGSYYGATVAGPVFTQLAKGVIRHFGLQPTEPLQSNKAPSVH